MFVQFITGGEMTQQRWSTNVITNSIWHSFDFLNCKIYFHCIDNVKPCVISFPQVYTDGMKYVDHHL